MDDGAGRRPELENLLDRLRTNDPDRFRTLLKMHLSFQTRALTAEDLEMAVGERCPPEERNAARNSQLKKRLGTRNASNDSGAHRGVFGAPLTQEGIAMAEQLLQFLQLPKNLKEEGLFRKSGSRHRRSKLERLLVRGESVLLDPFSPHDVATVLKLFLRDLPEPLLTLNHFPVYSQLADFAGDEMMSKEARKEANLKRVRAIRLLLLCLPEENRQLLRLLLECLSAVAAEPSNLMDTDALATIFLPIILCPRNLFDEKSAVELQLEGLRRLVAQMIRRQSLLFLAPPALLQDIFHHFSSAPFFKSARPNAEDVETSTRVRFAAGAGSTTTEDELAKLYADVQMMPDSKAKTKLLKRFTKHNRRLLGLTPDGASPSTKKTKLTAFKRRIFGSGADRRSKKQKRFLSHENLEEDSVSISSSFITAASSVESPTCSLDSELENVGSPSVIITAL